MRIPDSLLQNNFLFHLNRNRKNISDIQTQLATQSQVNKPSDNPLGNARIMRMQEQLNSIYSYQNNIKYAGLVLDDSTLSMQAMQDEILKVQLQLTQLNSAVVDDNLQPFADSIDSSIAILLELANSDFDGQYNFGGTDNGIKPFYYDEANKRVVANSSNMGGDRLVKISSGITQKFNITGKELFQSVYSQTGNLDSNAAVGSVQNNTSTVYDAEGNKYTFNVSYTKTAENTYDLNYSILDSNSNEIENKTISDVKFNAESGKFESIDGDSLGEIQIQNFDNKIDFIMDLNAFTEKDAASSINSKLSQNADIFNTLIGIREKLLSGEKPTHDQVDIVNKFNKHVLNKLSMAGGISIKLQATEQILTHREMDALEIISLEKDVDFGKAIYELETAQYSLDVSYRISAMILPKSLLDYL
jgi:flagellar hook-associated protein 3 FlgL